MWLWLCIIRCISVFISNLPSPYILREEIGLCTVSHGACYRLSFLNEIIYLLFFLEENTVQCVFFLSFFLIRLVINRINQGINHCCKPMPGIMVTMATINNFKVPSHTEIVSAVETLISFTLQIHYFHMSSDPSRA